MRTTCAFTRGLAPVWLVLFGLPTKGWPGLVDLGGWLNTEINVWFPGNEPNTLPLRQATTIFTFFSDL